VGITDRAVRQIVADLEKGGDLPRSREGRRNRYEVHLDRPPRYSVESHCEVGVLLNLILRPDQPDPGDPESGLVVTNLSGAGREPVRDDHPVATPILADQRLPGVEPA
jgi:hypothetical protein